MLRVSKLKDNVGNGNMHLKVAGKKFVRVWGGRSYARPKYMKFMKMAAEIDVPCDFNIPVQDFCVPLTKQVDDALVLAIDCIAHGEPLYVGCAGGMGRTGLMLALIAKAFQIKSPIPYTRKHYYGHAVETKEQYKFVTKYRVPMEVRMMVKALRFSAYVSRKNDLTIRNWKPTLNDRFRIWVYEKMKKFLTAPNTI